ncbi:MAG: EipA family protein [Parvularculaceae bacterium]
MTAHALKIILASGLIAVAGSLASCASPPEPAQKQAQTKEGYKTYDQGTVSDEAERFLGGASAGLADVLNRVFSDQGDPQAYIAGEEASAAIGVGLRYGKGHLYQPGKAPVKVFWSGPSVGFDAGANASKVFTLIYNLNSTDAIFRRYPGVDGSYYVVGGVGTNYQQNGRTILAPIRTGVGVRAGVNVGYLHYTRRYSVVPF